MAVKETNERVQITLTKKQSKWLKEFAKEHNITPSKYISWLLYRKAEEMITLLKLKKDDELTQEKFNEIIKAKWIDD